MKNLSEFYKKAIGVGMIGRMPIATPQAAPLPTSMAPVNTPRPGMFRSYLAGLEPTGSMSMDQGYKNPTAKGLTPAHIAGGATTGALLLPSLTTGVLEAIKGMKTRGFKGAIPGFIRGAKKPIGSLIGGLRSGKIIKRVKANPMAKVTGKENEAIKKIVQEAPISSLQAKKGVGGSIGVTDVMRMRRSKNVLQYIAKHNPELLGVIEKEIKKNVGGGIGALGFGGGIGALSAGFQYSKGRIYGKNKK